MNRDSNQYKETDLKYDKQLVVFLIENLLLGKKTLFPIRQSDEERYPDGSAQHSFSGTGYSEVTIED